MKNAEEMKKLKAEKGESVIPEGMYCHGKIEQDKNDPKGMRLIVHDRCPYWDIDESKPHQYNGFCWFLEKGDWELEEEKSFRNEQTGKIEKGSDLPFPTSLLWDACKECGIKIDE